MLRRVVVTGGGTGGHVYTGLAVLDEVRRRNAGAETTFLGGATGHEVELVPPTCHALATIQVLPLRLNGRVGAVRALGRIPAAVLAAAEILRERAPEVVLGIGGAASGPTLLAAWWLGIPTALHEQNAVPGLANRLAAPFVSQVLVGLPQVRGPFVTRQDVVLTGNPVRRELLGALEARPLGRRPCGTPADPIHLLVLGGSDGSTFLNQHLPAVLALARARSDTCFQVLHQAGAASCAALVAHYARAGLTAKVEPFIADMSAAYAAADVAFALAGAGTLAELGLGAVPSLIVPLGSSADDHQRENARHFARQGALRLLDERDWSDDGASGVLVQLLIDAPAREALGERFRRVTTADAAARIVDELENLHGDVRAARGR